MILTIVCVVITMGLKSTKEILDMLGFDCGYSVYPQKRFTEEERAAFRAALKELRFEETYI